MSHDPLRIAQRMDNLDASGIRKVFDLAAKMENPINLSIGQPDFDVPEPVKEAAIQAIRDGYNKYTQTQGLAELRAGVAEQCKREFGWDDDRLYLITSGVSGGLLLAMLTLVNPGDEVIFMDPYFVMYEHLTNLVGGVPVKVPSYPDFRPDPEKIEAAITDKTRFLLINSPSNPTGVVYTEDELKAIAQIARKHDLLVISDEIYDKFCYEPFHSMASFYENTLLLRGWSKSYAMTGWRMGWCTGPAAILEKMTMLQQYSFVCAPSMAQLGGLKALEVDVSDKIEAYQRKRDMVAEKLGPAFGLVKPQGTFYAFAPAPGGSGTEFVRKAIDRNVLVIPGNVFSDRDSHFRMCFTVPDDVLEEGLDILVKLAE
ncbi:MAG: pyridoxal phosphate-dependent aminotransferase [Phycisphaerae bacterium]